MTTPQIHATLEEAQMLKNAGWEAPTLYGYYYDFTGKISEWKCDHVKYINNLLFGITYAPTLGEIKLPEGWYVVLEVGKWAYHYPNGSAGWFETELEARIHAWITAKRNGLV
jgi:hypothetical protein